LIKLAAVSPPESSRVRWWCLPWPAVPRLAGSFQSPLKSSASVSRGVVASPQTRPLEQPVVDVLRRAAAFQQTTNPAPLPTGWAGVRGLVPTLPRWRCGRLRRSGRGYDGRIPTSALERGGEDVDPATAALPVLESGQASQVLARDRAEVGVDALSKPALRLASRRFADRASAGKPDVTAAGRGGFASPAKIPAAVPSAPRDACAVSASWPEIAQAESPPGLRHDRRRPRACLSGSPNRRCQDPSISISPEVLYSPGNEAIRSPWLLAYRRRRATATITVHRSAHLRVSSGQVLVPTAGFNLHRALPLGSRHRSTRSIRNPGQRRSQLTRVTVQRRDDDE
jgi:hypothetical protein